MCDRVGGIGFSSGGRFVRTLTPEEAEQHQAQPDDGVTEVWFTPSDQEYCLSRWETAADRDLERRVLTGALLTPAEIVKLQIDPAEYLAVLECGEPDTCVYRRSIVQMLRKADGVRNSWREIVRRVLCYVRWRRR